MNWASPQSYGWTDDIDAIATQGSTVRKSIHNPSYLIDTISVKYEDQISQISTDPPSIAYCYYWGCNSVCNNHRYLINQQWLLSSIFLVITHLVFAISSGLLWRRATSIIDPILPEKYSQAYPVVEAVVVGSPKSLVNRLTLPNIGRTKRRLNSLRF